MKLLITSLITFVVSFFCSSANADIIWRFDSNDGTHFLTGQLTTDGSRSDLANDQTFTLLSFDAITIQILPGTPDDLDSGSDWAGGVAPPFSSNLAGSIAWDADTMTAEVVGNAIFASTPGVTDYVQIGRVGAGVFSDTGFNPNNGSRYLQFLPTANFFAPIPEPSTSLLLLSALAVSVFGGVRRDSARNRN